MNVCCTCAILASSPTEHTPIVVLSEISNWIVGKILLCAMLISRTIFLSMWDLQLFFVWSMGQSGAETKYKIPNVRGQCHFSSCPKLLVCHLIITTSHCETDLDSEARSSSCQHIVSEISAQMTLTANRKLLTDHGHVEHFSWAMNWFITVERYDKVQ